MKQPPKDKALDFLDHENAPKPERTARVVIYSGGKKPPIVSEYLVSPAGNPIRYQETRGPGQKYPIPFDMRAMDGKETEVTERIVSNAAKQANKLLRESYDGYTYDGCTDRCLTWSDSGPGEFGKRGNGFGSYEISKVTMYNRSDYNCTSTRKDQTQLCGKLKRCFISTRLSTAWGI